MHITVAGQLCHLAVLNQSAAQDDRERPSIDVQQDLLNGAQQPTPILFVHGAANDGAVWQAVAAGLSRRESPLLIPDLPGHGRSQGAPLNSIEALADWLLALLDVLHLPRVTLVAHSMGALLALEAAARYPQRISQLALIGISAPMPVSEQLLEMAQHDPEQAYQKIAQYSHHLSQADSVTAASKAKIEATLALLKRSLPGVLATDLMNCHQYVNGLHAASQVACPTLLLLAQQDRMTPTRNVAPLQAALRQVERVDIADCGHALMSEQSEGVLAVLSRFLSEGLAGLV
ncbi:MAG: alpha/beta hydrolase [Pseudomonadota bacterium]